MIIAYIDEHRDEHGVEPICQVLTKAGAKIAPSTYYASKNRPPSARAISDAVLMPVLMALWVANRKVYGADKLWRAARRAGPAATVPRSATLETNLGAARNILGR